MILLRISYLLKCCMTVKEYLYVKPFCAKQWFYLCPASSKHAALQRLLMGLVYIGVYQAVYTFIPDDYLLTPTFQVSGLVVKVPALNVRGLGFKV